ncbi:MAG: dihydrodipicolinate synthase family protein [Chthonomonadales bacterium]|nr:dihydrodipicolinate synthase family protein [Chthonomonadales bacterium]
MKGDRLRRRLLEGMVIPAHPLALTVDRRLDERRQRALSRYYIAAGAGGLAVAVHTTQFAIRRPEYGMFRPALELAAEAAREADQPPVLITGVCGDTAQAVSEAETAAGLGYDAALVSLGALRDASEAYLVEHCRAVGDVLPIIGFYLQPAVGGRILSRSFWRRLCDLDSLAAIKVAPFNRYQTLDVLHAVADSGRADEIALYTGNDDHIIGDLITSVTIRGQSLRFHGGLLGQWSFGTRRAVELLRITKEVQAQGTAPLSLIEMDVHLTDLNSALFDAANGFRGCIAGIHEALRRQGLMEHILCLDPEETLSEGQAAEIERVLDAYPHLHDQSFIKQHRDTWLT